MGITVFDLDKGKNPNNFGFLFIPLQCRLQKCFYLNVVLCAKQLLKVKFWNWCPKTIWHNMTCVQFFSSKITPPYCTALIHVKIKNIILLHKQYKKIEIYSNSPTKRGGGEGSQAGNDAKLKESQASDR